MTKGDNLDTTEIKDDLTVNVKFRNQHPEYGAIFEGSFEGVFFSFAHNNKVWHFNVAETEEKAQFGKGPRELLFNMNGHYQGPMANEIIDSIVGLGCAIYRHQKQQIPEGGFVQ